MTDILKLAAQKCKGECALRCIQLVKPSAELEALFLKEKKSLGIGVKELYAFHGTSQKNIEVIVTETFISSKGGKAGAGIYLAVKPSVAAKYIPQNENQMIMVRILASFDEEYVKGEYCIRSNIRVLPVAVLTLNIN